MEELEAGADLTGGSDGDDDDIARFERQCAERAKAEGLYADGPEENERGSDDEDERIRKVRLVTASGAEPRDNGEWRRKCELLQEKLSRREAELSQVKGDLDMLRSDGVGPGDPAVELKQRLIEITKKNRRLQVTVETQKSRLSQLEAEAKKPREEAKKQAVEIAMQNNDAFLGDGMEDWKKKYLTASNKLQEMRHEMQDARAQLHRHRKVLLKEIGSEEATEKALAMADDPHESQWKGRASQIAQLQRQVRELKDQMRRAGGVAEEASEMCMESTCGGDTTPQRRQRGRAEPVADKERAALSQVAEKRREEFERLQEEAERLRGEQAEVKRKRDALKSRNGLLEGQLRELKASLQDLVRKSDNDTALVAALRRQLGRHGANEEGNEEAVEQSVEELRQENVELQAQLERQAQIVLQLRQKSLAASCENGSARLGPKSVESSTGERQLIERVRFLEAENAKQQEQVRLFREQLGEETGSGPGRPFSAGSSLNLKEKLRQMGERLGHAERENLALRAGRSEHLRPDSSHSCVSNRSGSSGEACDQLRLGGRPRACIPA
mmetsp:Transcript_26403/g.59650  ORF Transcript_26403/g.59650 Transcript_26403/m.59650 type:complete len:557 (-) Transcript_26403:50-1720(-)